MGPDGLSSQGDSAIPRKSKSKLYTIFMLQTFVNHFLHIVEIIAIKLLRTDTTLDLSQKAEKSYL